MPSRANLMTPGQMYEMTPSRFGVPLKVLTNKKALDVAFMKHTWEMQKSAKEMASGEEKQRIAGRYGLAQQRLRNKGYEKSAFNESIAKQAMDYVKANAIEIDTPEGQETYKKIYQFLLTQSKGGQTSESGASDLATGQTPDSMPSIQEGTSGGAVVSKEILPSKNTSESTVIMITPDAKEWPVLRSKINEAKRRGAKIKK